MAYITSTSRPVSNGSFFADLKAAFSERLAQYRAYRTTREELAQLSDRELSDLGVTRFDIDAIARQAALRA